MQIFRDFIKVIDRQTIGVTAAACIATALCLIFDVTIDLRTDLIAIAIVFPIVFSINAAYKRREEALGYFASLKAHSIALYYGHRDWAPDNSPEHARRMRPLIEDLLKSIHRYFISPEEKDAQFQEVYGHFSEISSSIEKLRHAGATPGDISNANQTLRAMMTDFEKMRNIYLYRTPTALRAYSHVFLLVFPVLFAPSFAKLSEDYFTAAGFMVAAVYSLVLVSLDNIQEHLENPYDEVGADDLRLNVVDSYKPILGEGMVK